MLHKRIFRLLVLLALTAPILTSGQEYQPTKSEIIKVFMYNTDTQMLTVLFDSGLIREHRSVPPDVYQGLLDAPLKGGYYKSFIERAYPYSEKNKTALEEPSSDPEGKAKAPAQK